MKLAIIIRKDLNISCGKIAVQVAHAATECILKCKKEKVIEWHKEGGKKIVLVVNNIDELKKLQYLAEQNNLTNALVTDAGFTEIKPGTITCLGIGPDKDKRIDELIGSLPLL